MRLLIVATTLLLSACGSGTPEPVATPSVPAQGREETQGIRNTQAIGVPGEAIADRVDHALDAQEQQQKKLDEQIPQ